MSEDKYDDRFANCVVCNGQAFGRMACTHCEARLSGWLYDILEFYAIAEGELAPGKTGSGGGTERSIGVRIAALDFLAGNDAVAVLGSWECEWREHYGLTEVNPSARAKVTLLSAVTFLRQWLPTACESHPAVDDFAREVRESWQIARDAARHTPERRQSITCPSDTDDGICGYRIQIKPERLGEDITCRRCGTDWNIAHLMHVAISTPGAEVWADPEAAAGYFGTPTSTLRRWGASDKIKRSHGRYELHSIYTAIHGDTASGFAI